jgi:CheY-like chemotaxis protein
MAPAVLLLTAAMPTILLFDDDPAVRAAIERGLSDVEHRLLEVGNPDDFFDRLAQEHVELAIISLAAISEDTAPRFQQALLGSPDTKILALASIEGGNGLTTLLKAESLRAHHLLAKPIDPQQFLAILQVLFPLPTGQD